MDDDDDKFSSDTTKCNLYGSSVNTAQQVDTQPRIFGRGVDGSFTRACSPKEGWDKGVGGASSTFQSYVSNPWKKHIFKSPVMGRGRQ